MVLFLLRGIQVVDRNHVCPGEESVLVKEVMCIAQACLCTLALCGMTISSYS